VGERDVGNDLRVESTKCICSCGANEHRKSKQKSLHARVPDVVLPEGSWRMNL